MECLSADTRSATCAESPNEGENSPRSKYHGPRFMNPFTSSTILSFTPLSNTTLSNNLRILGRPKGFQSAPHAV